MSPGVHGLGCRDRSNGVAHPVESRLRPIPRRSLRSNVSSGPACRSHTVSRAIGDVGAGRDSTASWQRRHEKRVMAGVQSWNSPRDPLACWFLHRSC